MANDARIRQNNIQGTLSSTLTAAATTMVSAALANLQAITSTQHAVIVLDPGRANGAPEFVRVTAHTASSTKATVVRGSEGTAARTHPTPLESWLHAPTIYDWTRVLSSTSRPVTNIFDGQTIYERDSKKLYVYNGTDWAPYGAGGQIGYAQVTASQTGITTAVDLTGLTVTVTVPTSRRIRITGFVQQFIRTAGTVTFVNLAIFEGGTQLQIATSGMNNTYEAGFVQVVLTPSAGSHTYKLQAAGDGTVTMTAAANGPCFILVEDIGPA